ncbi:MAG: flagellar basal body-associated FliL family protein [Candidatus Latescibacteria bacterium]|jgi:flagellar basal body-associated protein FliL|nr:flagellar basal body-associated FliL family protein [Candidatus Latescibacterota bacterium]
MAEEDVEELEGEEGGPPPAPKRSRLGQFILLAAVVLLGQSAVAYVLVTRFVLPKHEMNMGEEAGKVVKQAPAEREKIPVDMPFLYAFKDDLLLNPSDEEALRFLSVKVILELDNEGAWVEIQSSVLASKVRDEIFLALNAIPYTDMNEAKERLQIRETLKDRINAAGLLKSGEVKGVFFERFILH